MTVIIYYRRMFLYPGQDFLISRDLLKDGPSPEVFLEELLII